MPRRSVENSIRYIQLMDECGLRETPDGDVIDEDYYPLIMRMKALIRFASIPCKYAKMLGIKSKDEVDRKLAHLNMLIAKACSVPGAQKDADLVLTGVELENIVVQATGRRNPKHCVETIHAQILRLAA